MKAITGTAPSLEQFHHTDEIYKYTGLPQDCPRKGDYAEVIKDHCVSSTGQIMEVVDFPHWCMLICGHCGQYMYEWQVQVVPVTDWGKWDAIAPGGPFFYPINWLKRWEASKIRAVE